MKKLRLREFRNLAEGHKASRWQTWDSNLGCQLVRLHCGLPPGGEGVVILLGPDVVEGMDMNQIIECF